MSTRQQTAPFRPLPVFGVEIEIFVKLKRTVASNSRGGTHWLGWDFSLSNRSTDEARIRKQRSCVRTVIEHLIKEALGQCSKWKATTDASLKESDLTVPPESTSWWGVEIISPPISVSKQWQREIRAVFAAIGAQFDLWTHPCTSTHVHVSPGPGPDAIYTNRQFLGVAKGALYWEKALTQLLPHDRRNNTYAKPNHTAFANTEYNQVAQRGWGRVFDKVDDLMEECARVSGPNRSQKFCFCVKFAGGSIYAENVRYRSERYLSTNFLPFTHHQSIELRRQGGVASAESAIHRVLLALTLHVSARCYHFSEHASQTTHPSVGDLIRELGRCIKMLPPTCHGSRFIYWMNTCRTLYSGNALSEAKINESERRLHNTLPSSGGASSQSQPQPQPQPHQTQPLLQPRIVNVTRWPEPEFPGGGNGGSRRRDPNGGLDRGREYGATDLERQPEALRRWNAA